MEQVLQQLLDRVDSSRRDLVQLSNNLDLIRMDLVTCIQSVASPPPPPVPLTNSVAAVKLEEDCKPALKTLNQSTVSKIKTEPKKDVCNCPNFPGHSVNHPSGHHHHHALKKTKVDQSIVKDEMPSIPSIPPNQVADLLTYPTGGGGGSSSISNSDEVGDDNKVIQSGRKRPLDSTQSTTAPSTHISRSTNVNLESASNSGSSKRLAVVGLSQSPPSLAQPTGPLESDDDDESSVDGRDVDDSDDEDYQGEEEETETNDDEDTDEDDDEDGQLKPFLCPYEGCEKRYTRNSSLYRHVRLHTGERPFVCDRCGSSFTQKEHLKTHYLTHTTERPFFCGIFECNKTFKSKNDLHQHQRNVLHRSR